MVELLSIACGTVTVACTVLLARLYQRERPWLWLGAGTAAAAVPAFAFLSTAVTNDNLVAALCSVTLVLLASWLVHGSRPWACLAALSASLAVLAKFNAVGLLACFVIVLLFKERRWRPRLFIFGQFCLIGAIVDGWWLVRNTLVYGEPTAMLALNRTLTNGAYSPFSAPPAAALHRIFGDLPKVFHSFFVVFGVYNIDAPPAYAIIASLWTVGFVVGLAKVIRARGSFQIVLIIWPAVLLLEIIGYIYISTADGRFLYPALAPFAVITVVGWDLILRRARLPRLAPALPLTVAVVASVCAWLVVAPAYAEPPRLATLPASARPLHATFDQAVELIGIDAPLAQVVVPGQAYPITLYWRLTQPVDVPLSAFVHVQSSDSAYDPGVDFEGAPGHGTSPPNFWQSGQIVADRYTLRLNPDTRPDRRNAVRLSIRVGMYYLSPEPGSTIQKVSVEPGSAADSGFEVAAWKLAGKPPLALPGQPLARFSGGLELNSASVNGGVGGSLQVNLRWLATAAPAKNYTVFVQALAADGRLLGQHDSYPLAGSYPTLWWSAGEQVFDTISVSLARPLQPGDRVIAGLYVLPEAGKRIPTDDGRGFVELPMPLALPSGRGP